MFELNKEIKKWKSSLSSSDTCSRADIDELESHLLDSMDILRAKGLSQEEAFFVAIRRLGSTNALSCEFGKVNENLRAWRMVLYAGLGIIFYTMINSLCSIVSNGMQALLIKFGYEVSYIRYITPVVGIITFLFAVLLGYFIFKYHRRSIAKFFSSPSGRISLVFLLLLVICAGIVVSHLSSFYAVNQVGASEYGQIAIIGNIFNIALAVLKPMSVVIAVAILWTRGRHKLA